MSKENKLNAAIVEWKGEGGTLGQLIELAEAAYTSREAYAWTWQNAKSKDGPEWAFKGCGLSTPVPLAPKAIPPDAALQRLMDGNVRYVANAPEKKDYAAGRAANVNAQHPFAAVLSCSDSRVEPELVFDQGLGDIFVVRVAGNFADDDGLATLEYAVEHLGVPLVMVLGHSHCGAVQAAVEVVTERAELPGHLPELVKSIEPAVIAAQARHPSDLVAAAVEENVKLNVKRLKEDAPILADALGSGKLGIQGGVYDLATGKVALL